MRKRFPKAVRPIIFSLLVCFLLAGCGPGRSAEDIEIIDSGFSSNEDGDYTYAIVFENHSDKVIKMAIFDVEAYDESGKKLKPLDQWYTAVRTDNVRPGERAACTVMMKQKEQDETSDGTMAFDGVPADIRFELSSDTSFKAPDGNDPDLKLVGYERLGDDAFSNAFDHYDGDFIAFKVRIANNGEEDFIYDPHSEETDTFLCCHVVYKDADGKVIGGAGDLYYSNAPDEGDASLLIKAGEEAECYFTGPYCYWPSAGQELYLEAVR